MPAPLTPQGTLNRLIGSVAFVDSPELNVTASFLGEEGIGLSLEGETTTFLNTMTGAVTSPEPYQRANITLHLLRTQGLADSFKQRMESNAIVGNLTVYTDSTTLSTYPITNCAIESVGALRINGKDAGFVVSLKGYYEINSQLWG